MRPEVPSRSEYGPLKLISLDVFQGVFQGGSIVNRTALSCRFPGLNPLQPKHAFSAALDRFSLVPTADFWAVRSGPAVSVALAGSAGFQVSAPDQASADRYFVGCDFLDLTFSFSFAGLSVVGKLLQSY